ncbi:hypothetical protein WHJ47_14405, partial [Staphylococcus aureus]|uniref:hypothetical protein n=1 Tax=Staphylococcus aureus TaxID=1280 RepID=UPI0039BE5CA5
MIQFTGTGSINAGDGLSKTGNTLDVDLAPNKGLEFDTNQLAVKLDTTKGLGFSGYGHVVA